MTAFLAAFNVPPGAAPLTRRGVAGARVRALGQRVRRTGEHVLERRVRAAGSLVKFRPLFGAAAVADKVQSSATAVPPSLLMTLLTSLSCGVLSVLVIVQVTMRTRGPP